MTRKVIDRQGPQEPGKVGTIRRGMGEGIGCALTIEMNDTV